MPKMKMYMKKAQSKSSFVFWKGNGLMGVAVAMAIWAWAVICITVSMASEQELFDKIWARSYTIIDAATRMQDMHGNSKLKTTINKLPSSGGSKKKKMSVERGCDTEKSRENEKVG